MQQIIINPITPEIIYIILSSIENNPESSDLTGLPFLISSPTSSPLPFPSSSSLTAPSGNVGLNVGCFVGCNVGFELGFNVGFVVGFNEGAVGADVGFIVGDG